MAIVVQVRGGTRVYHLSVLDTAGKPGERALCGGSARRGAWSRVPDDEDELPVCDGCGRYAYVAKHGWAYRWELRE